MIEGLKDLHATSTGIARPQRHQVGRAIPAYSDWGDLDLNYEIIAKIDS